MRTASPADDEVVRNAAAGEPRRGRWIRMRCPFADCAGKKGKSLNIAETGWWKCERCCKEGHLGGGSIARVPHRVIIDDNERRIARAREVVERSRPIQNHDVADVYLRETRKLEPIHSKIWPSDLRTGNQRHGKDGPLWPALVATIRTVTGDIRGAHVTYLTREGTKAPVDPQRRMYGVVQGCAAHLGPDRDVMVVAEGIETTLALMRVAGEICGWATLSANGMRDLVLPKWVKKIIIGVDNDPRKKSGALGDGIVAAQTLAARCSEIGLRYRMAIPPRKDWADFG